MQSRQLRAKSIVRTSYVHTGTSLTHEYHQKSMMITTIDHAAKNANTQKYGYMMFENDFRNTG